MKKIFFILFILCFRIKQFGQVTSGGLPYTFEINTINPTLLNYRGILSSINQTVLPNLDNIALKQQAENESASCVDCKNFYYGKFLNQNINIISQGTYELIDNVKVYRYKVISPTAEALQFYFTQFNVPEGGRLYIYNEDKTILFGALTSDNINYTSQDVIKLATVPIHGGSLVLEYNEPLDSPFSASIEIGYIVHVFDKKFSSAPSDKSASCNNDVVCPTGYGWDNEKKAVVMILSRTPNTDWGGFCTGTLLNNTTNNKTPYLITAGHCFRSETNVVDPVFHPGSSLYVFNYENINCNDNIETTFNLTNSIYGAYDLSTKYINSNNTVSYDYSLLKLKAENDQNPSSYYDKYLSRFGVCFAGWNRSTTLNSNQKPYVIIHHPNGDNKKITVTKLNEDAKSVNKIGEIPSPSGAHFEVKYSTGVTERGSSGAALFDSYHKLIGTLWGGKSDCGIDGLAYNEEPDLYFKFSRAWTDGNFQAWLDPI
ncbi:MAG TPA: trypsin-like peptidase domain-containing protein, partial [Bacteroidia bacterium]|nr:trypsin-like peptidase domain-containing protein [Bacteroidia bacterium]